MDGEAAGKAAVVEANDVTPAARDLNSDAVVKPGTPNHTTSPVRHAATPAPTAPLEPPGLLLRRHQSLDDGMGQRISEGRLGNPLDKTRCRRRREPILECTHTFHSRFTEPSELAPQRRLWGTLPTQHST